MVERVGSVGFVTPQWQVVDRPMSRIKTEHWETENPSRSPCVPKLPKRMRKILYCRGISSLPFSGSTPSFASPLSVSPRAAVPVMSTVYISDLIQPAPVHRMEKQFRGRRCSPLGQYLVQARVSVDRGARCFSLDRWRRCWRTRRTRTTRLRTTTCRRRLRLRRRTTTRRPLIWCDNCHETLAGTC